MDDIYVDLRTQNDWIRFLFPTVDFVSVEDIIEKLEELYDENEGIKEEFEDFKRDVEDNYKRVSISEQLDISDRDFI